MTNAWLGRPALLLATVLLAHLALSAIGQRASVARGQAEQATADWPPVTHETRPWTRWWWLGGAVDHATITRELESFKAVGLGGVEITPIYGVRGREPDFVPYLSDAWVQRLEHTLSEARRLGLGVDLATGTGWPFGGPWVGEADAPRALLFRTWSVAGGQRLEDRVALQQQPLVRALGRVAPEGRPPAIADLVEPVEANRHLQALALEQIRFPKDVPLLALMAHGSAGEVVDLTARVGTDQRLDWRAPPGQWTLHAAFLGWHGKLVERAAPGGEGNVIDHFSRGAIQRYLARFSRALDGRAVSGIRAYFNDSYEVDDATGEADATPALFEEFQKRRGYDLRSRLAALTGRDTTEMSSRVLADYRLTISDLLLETFTTEWSGWARARGSIVRNQAHGSPANLLDLYGASDIPETEGTEIERAKWASSAGHVAGRRLIAAEAATWLGEHFRSTLADVRAALDLFFVAGVNHIVYHGTAASPAGLPWPGWLFYAAVEFNDRNPWWRDFPALNSYVTRVQSFLQADSPDHDVLLYYPFYDFAAVGESGGRLAHFGGANVASRSTRFEAARDLMQRRGFTYDFVSDRQLQLVRVDGRDLVTGGDARYSTIVVPGGRYMLLETLEHLLRLARDGATLVLFGNWAEDVAGLANLDARRRQFERMTASVSFAAPDARGVAEARVGRGRVLRGADLEGLLAAATVTREPMADIGLGFARRRSDRQRTYFVSNATERDIDGWVPIAWPHRLVMSYDAMRGSRAALPTRPASDERMEVWLELPAGESIILTTAASGPGPGAAAAGRGTETAAGPAIPLAGRWTLRFIAGGPSLPATRTLDRLISWTISGGDDVRDFSGTAIYSLRVPRPRQRSATWRLDLGRVHDSAHVTLNGVALATLIGPRYTLMLRDDQLRDTNVLEIAVTNLMANRIAAMDRAGTPWKIFYNINFPSRLPENRGPDGLFTAAKWAPLPSGLLGPVVLTPIQVRSAGL